MAKVFNNIDEVMVAREAGKSITMNMVAAIEALKATPVKAPRASSSRDSEFSSDVRALFEEAVKSDVRALSAIQVANMYAAAKGIEMPSDAKELAKFKKKFYEHCLAKSDQPSKKNPHPVYHYNGAGLFSIFD